MPEEKNINAFELSVQRTIIQVGTTFTGDQYKLVTYSHLHSVRVRVSVRVRKKKISLSNSTAFMLSCKLKEQLNTF